MAVSDGETITVVKDMGLVTQVFDERRLAPLEGHLAIGHGELGTFTFAPNDRVWVFSYSRDEAENAALLKCLGEAGVAEVGQDLHPEGVAPGPAVVAGVDKIYFKKDYDVKLF